MGSAGAGEFGTYKDNGAGALPDGKADDFECPLKIELISLEDVAISDYYINTNSVPSVGEPVELSPVLCNKRLVVISQSTQKVLGNLSVVYNYLLLCMSKGMSYSGSVVSSGMSPVPYVVVTLNAN